MLTFLFKGAQNGVTVTPSFQNRSYDLRFGNMAAGTVSLKQ